MLIPSLKLSSRGRKLLITLEGSKSTVYRDVGGILTIGVGHALTREEIMSGRLFVMQSRLDYRQGLSSDDIEGLLSNDLSSIEYVVNKAIAYSVQLEQYQFDCLCIFVFNVGRNAFLHSTLLKKLNTKDYNAVPVRRWVYAGGKIIKGLVHRRECEVRLWELGSYID